jgi:adenylate cyclase
MPGWTASLERTFAEFRRRRVFRAVAAYLVVAWVLVQLGSAVFQPLGLPDWSMRLLLVLLAIGFVLACVLAWVYDVGTHGIERTAPMPAASTDPAPAAPAPLPHATPATQAPDASVAILPFADLSEAHDQDYFCDGLAEEILNALAKIRDLRVASRTSSFRFRGSDTDARDIGRALNVAAIMEGSVRKAGERVRVTAQLIDAANGYHLWSENFDRKLEDIFAIQEEIARSVARALRVSLKTADALDFERNAPRDVRAYDFYLRGRQLQALKSTFTWTAAPEMFRRAIALDPEYAQAHAGLADALVELLLWRLARPEDVLDEALAASRRALELAPDLAEAHVAHANTLHLSGSTAASEAAFAKAIALDPNLYEAHYYFARHLFASGQDARAVEEFEAAHRARPDEFQALTLAVMPALAIGDAARSEELARRALKLALAEAEMDPENGRARYLAAGLQLRLGDIEGGRRNVEAALRLRPEDFGTLYNAACFHALAGEPDRALDLLDRAIATGQGFRDWIEHDHDLASLRALPRFRQIMARFDPSEEQAAGG